jgi:hypothetical protein
MKETMTANEERDERSVSARLTGESATLSSSQELDAPLFLVLENYPAGIVAHVHEVDLYDHADSLTYEDVRVLFDLMAQDQRFSRWRRGRGRVMKMRQATGFDGVDYTIGDRIEVHLGCDLWMRGARFGEVVGMSLTAQDRVRVKLDRTGGKVWSGPEDRFRKVWRIIASVHRGDSVDVVEWFKGG